MKDIDALIAPVAYQLAQAERREAYERYNYAAKALEFAKIMERYRELSSQWEPINTIIGSTLDERDKLCAVAYYVLCGRLPDSIARPEQEKKRSYEGPPKEEPK